jgi:hypothetical protein
MKWGIFYDWFEVSDRQFHVVLEEFRFKKIEDLVDKKGVSAHGLIRSNLG